MKKLVLVVTFLFPFIIAAAPYSLNKTYETLTGSKDLLDEVTIGAAEASRTITKNVAGYVKLVQYIQITDADSDVTSIEVDCLGSIDGTNYGSVTSASITSGTRTLTKMQDTFVVADEDEEIVNVHDVWGYSMYKCIYSATGGDANDDKLTVQWQAVVGK